MTVRVETIGGATLMLGDCREILPTLAADSIGAVITDPPYHLTSAKIRELGHPSWNSNCKRERNAAKLGFMGKEWDGGDVAFRPETWAEVYRVTKPGAFLVAFASTRGYHRMTCAIEDAGFVVHPMLGWLFGTGFPKATRFKNPGMDGWRYGMQALKPGLEPICMAQKPLDGTGTENWERWGVGGLHIDACRLETGKRPWREHAARMTGDGGVVYGDYTDGSRAVDDTTLGRWPANVCHDGSEEVLAALALAGERPTCSPSQIGQGREGDHSKGIYGAKASKITTAYGDSGTAARFFYTAKATAEDRAGSKHPTVKPLALMDWLVKLVTPPGETILDPFAGTGTTLLAADRLQFNAIGIEREAEYFADIRRRLRGDSPLFADLFAVPADPADARLADRWREPEE